MEHAAKRFFSASHFAVVGASQNTLKFGYRILAWYHVHSLPVTPVNPNRPSISLPSKIYDTAPTVSALPDPSLTALSFLTPPHITRTILKEAKSVGITSVWLQPGSFDEDVMTYAKENFDTTIGGFDEGSQGGEGWCVLVDGESSMQAANREFKRQKL